MNNNDRSEEVFRYYGMSILFGILVVLFMSIFIFGESSPSWAETLLLLGLSLCIGAAKLFGEKSIVDRLVVTIGKAAINILRIKFGGF